MPEAGPMSSLLMLLRSELFLVTLNSTPEGKAVGIQAPTYTGILACSVGALADLGSDSWTHKSASLLGSNR